ncbi:MAG: hypothetical protein ABJC26_04580, partial [Gemmatimonadaceae bacterium]
MRAVTVGVAVCNLLVTGLVITTVCARAEIGATHASTQSETLRDNRRAEITILSQRVAVPESAHTALVTLAVLIRHRFFR